MEMVRILEIISDEFSGAGFVPVGNVVQNWIAK
jgi:hypothetical protein